VWMAWWMLIAVTLLEALMRSLKSLNSKMSYTSSSTAAMDGRGPLRDDLLIGLSAPAAGSFLTFLAVVTSVAFESVWRLMEKLSSPCIVARSRGTFSSFIDIRTILSHFERMPLLLLLDLFDADGSDLVKVEVALSSLGIMLSLVMVIFL